MDNPACDVEKPWYAAKTVVAGVAFDRKAGYGWTSLNHDITYFGMATLMRVSVFLDAALPLSTRNEESIAHFKAAIAAGDPLSPAFLTVDASELEEYGNPYEVTGHEGRHRMTAILESVGNVVVPVHIAPLGRRARDLEDADVALMRDRMLRQLPYNAPRGGARTFVDGPLFEEARVNKRTLSFDPPGTAPSF